MHAKLTNITNQFVCLFYDPVPTKSIATTKQNAQSKKRETNQKRANTALSLKKEARNGELFLLRIRIPRWVPIQKVDDENESFV